MTVGQTARIRSSHFTQDRGPVGRKLPVTIMTPMLHSDRSALPVTLDDFIETHGRWRVLLALLVRPMRPKARLPSLGLNTHLRRDIGLEPLEDIGPHLGWPR